MTARVPALVTPTLLSWARETAGYTVEAAADKTHIKAEDFFNWESGADYPSVAQLRKLAGLYHRPLAVFYLPFPPQSPPSPHDFRRLADTEGRRPSPDLLLEIRQARWRRELALELYEEVEGTPPKYFDIKAELSDDPEDVGTLIRNALGIRYEDQIRWRSPHDALKQWRAGFERLGVFVFQASGIPTNEMRGFAISEFPMPVIVINGSDHPNARIFTMLHEFTHILLREHSLCDIYEDESEDRTPSDQRIEVFCNYVAGAALVPRQYFLLEQVISSTTTPRVWSDQELKVFAQKYRVSQEVILRRLLITGKTTQDFYRSRRAKLQAEFEEQVSKKKKDAAPGFLPPAQRALLNAGTLFTRLVFDSYHRDYITPSDVSEYLGIRYGQFSNVETGLQSQLPNE